MGISSTNQFSREVSRIVSTNVANFQDDLGSSKDGSMVGCPLATTTDLVAFVANTLVITVATSYTMEPICLNGTIDVIVMHTNDIRQMASLVELISLVESNNGQSKHQGHDSWFKNQWMQLTKQPA
ncbi:unnamed protein product [Phytophthora fragariaefolia]|uniref:Unnamed protein product n=1 Tax=Phytophthora fragariaefolia TaxID=1490495 RepID=A0A9W6Y715_9STRA|nr:unnamed protein product [Phytophthora fragariaefolia]